MRLSYFAAVVGMIALGSLPALTAAEGEPAGMERFEKKVRPLLAARCWQCHGPEKNKGGLRLDSGAAIGAGGDSGPAVLPGKPNDSRLIQAIGYAGELKMPPKAKLAAAEIAELTEWVRAGAVWPDAGTTRTGPASRPAADGPLFTAEQKSFWAFQPPRDPVPPHVKAGNWPTSPVDRFILAALEKTSLTPASPADRRTLIRRATFDLIGLPPTPAEVEAFLADQSPEAFRKGRRSAAGVAPLWRAVGTTLARSRALCRLQRDGRKRRVCQCLSLSRLRDPGLQCRQALRSVRHRTDRRRPASARRRRVARTTNGSSRPDFSCSGPRCSPRTTR